MPLSDLESFVMMCQRANIACVTGRIADVWAEASDNQQGLCVMNDDGDLVMACFLFDLHGKLVDVVKE